MKALPFDEVITRMKVDLRPAASALHAEVWMGSYLAYHQVRRHRLDLVVIHENLCALDSRGRLPIALDAIRTATRHYEEERVRHYGALAHLMATIDCNTLLFPGIVAKAQQYEDETSDCWIVFPGQEVPS